MSNLVFLELTYSDARKAKLAISKTGRERYGRGDEGYDKEAVERVKEELGKGFDNMSSNEKVRLEFRTDDAGLIPSAVEIHARDRRDKEHYGSAKKYQSVADKIEHQLTMQGVMVA